MTVPLDRPEGSDIHPFAFQHNVVFYKKTGRPRHNNLNS